MSAVKEKTDRPAEVRTQPQALEESGPEAKPTARESVLPPMMAGSPFVFMRRFAEDMERFFEDFGSFRLAPLFRRDLWPRVTEFGRAVWSPEVEVFERDGRLVVRADLPGLKREDVKVEVTGEALTVSGERRDEAEERGEGFYRTERTYGSFFRRVPLPEGVVTEEATATFRDGVLEVVMPAPKREPQARVLEIRETAGGEAGAAAK